MGRRFVSGMLRCCRCTEHLYERTLTAVRCLTGRCSAWMSDWPCRTEGCWTLAGRPGGMPAETNSPNQTRTSRRQVHGALSSLPRGRLLLASVPWGVVCVARRLSLRKMMMSWCLMSSDVIWHIRDKLWPMPKHGSIILYVHGNQKAR